MQHEKQEQEEVVDEVGGVEAEAEEIEPIEEAEQEEVVEKTDDFEAIGRGVMDEMKSNAKKVMDLM